MSVLPSGRVARLDLISMVPVTKGCDMLRR